jgi:hypothetical protein
MDPIADAELMNSLDMPDAISPVERAIRFVLLSGFLAVVAFEVWLVAQMALMF